MPAPTDCAEVGGFTGLNRCSTIRFREPAALRAFEAARSTLLPRLDDNRRFRSQAREVAGHAAIANRESSTLMPMDAWLY